jgi:hypothetical protein
MRYMMMIKAQECMPPSPELMAAVARHAAEIRAKGILLQAEGLASTAAGARVRLANAKLTVTDGPFAETKEVIGGFAILKAGSRAEAIELGRQFMQLHADILGPSFEAECEIREMFDGPPPRA